MSQFSAIRLSWPWLLMGCGGLVVFTALVPQASAADKERSQLWGEGGQQWDRAGRLTDFSYAGYHRGECPLPELSPAANIKANHANLFTDLDAGVGTNIFLSGGGAKLGRHCGAWSTWWNIRTERPVRFPAGWAPDMINIVGVGSTDPTITDAEGRWFEPIAPDRLQPRDLHQAQLERRLGTATSGKKVP